MAGSPRDYYVDIDMHLYQVKNLILHKNVVGSTTAQIGYNTSTKRATIHDGTANRKVLQENDILDEDDLVSNSNTHVPTQQSVKAYVDDLETRLGSTANGEGASMIGVEDTGGYYTATDLEAILAEIGVSLQSAEGSIDLQGDLNASGNPNYPAASKGHAYYISVAGKVGGASGKVVNIGDLLIAKADNAGGTEAAVGTSWFVLESNRSQATETVLGVLKIATDAVVETGTNDTDAITALKLKNRLSGVGMVSHEKIALTGKDTASVSAVNQGTKTFTVTGGITSHLQEGNTINVTGSTGNDGLYTVVSVALNVSDTDIVVEETIPDPTNDGTVEYGVKNDVTLTSPGIDATDLSQIQVFDSGVKVDFPYIEILSATQVRVWFLSPATGTFEAAVQGKFGF